MEEIRYWLEAGDMDSQSFLVLPLSLRGPCLYLWWGGFTSRGKPGLTCDDGTGCEESMVDWNHCGHRVEFCGLIQEPMEDGNY